MFCSSTTVLFCGGGTAPPASSAGCYIHVLQRFQVVLCECTHCLRKLSFQNELVNSVESPPQVLTRTCAFIPSAAALFDTGVDTCAYYRQWTEAPYCQLAVVIQWSWSGVKGYGAEEVSFTLIPLRSLGNPAATTGRLQHQPRRSHTH